MTTPLQDRMQRDLAQKTIFESARKHAFAYADGIAGRPVVPDAAALAGLAAFDEPLPQAGVPAQDILALLDARGSPATIAQTGGRYFGFVNGGAAPVTLAVKWLTDFWDQNAALDVMSPVTGKLEAVCEKWLIELFGLPDETVAGFVSGSSIAIFAGLAAARWRAFANAGWDINTQGFAGAPRVRIVTGRQAHGTVVKAIALLGFGLDNIEWVDVDDQGRVRAENLPELDERTIVILQAGNIATGAFDEFGPICEMARKAGAWVHVDGAFGLWAAGTERLRHLTAGMEGATSWSADGHKTLNTPYDNGFVLCRDAEALTSAMQASGSYIAWSGNRDGMRTTPEMSRRARAAELWALLKYLGRDGVDELVGQLHDHARQMAGGLVAEGYELLNEVVFNQVLVRCASDTATTAAMAAIQQSGTCWAGGATWQGRPAIRVSICSWATTDQDIAQSVEVFGAALRAAEDASP